MSYGYYNPIIVFKEQGVVKAHEHKITEVPFSTDGACIATAGHDGWCRVFDVATMTQVHQLRHTHPITSVAWYAHLHRLVACGQNGVLYEVARFTSTKKWSHRIVCHSLLVADRCAVSVHHTVAVACQAHHVTIFDGSFNYSFRQKITGLTGNACSVAFSPSGNLLVVGCTTGTHYVFSRRNKHDPFLQVFNTKHSKCEILTFCFNSAETTFLVGSRDPTATLWSIPPTPHDPSTWPTTPLVVYSVHTNRIMAVNMNADCTIGLTASLNGVICVWRLSDGKTYFEFNARKPVREKN